MSVSLKHACISDTTTCSRQAVELILHQQPPNHPTPPPVTLRFPDSQVRKHCVLTKDLRTAFPFFFYNSFLLSKALEALNIKKKKKYSACSERTRRRSLIAQMNLLEILSCSWEETTRRCTYALFEYSLKMKKRQTGSRAAQEVNILPRYCMLAHCVVQMSPRI